MPPVLPTRVGMVRADVLFRLRRKFKKSVDWILTGKER